MKAGRRFPLRNPKGQVRLGSFELGSFKLGGVSAGRYKLGDVRLGNFRLGEPPKGIDNCPAPTIVKPAQEVPPAVAPRRPQPPASVGASSRGAQSRSKPAPSPTDPKESVGQAKAAPVAPTRQRERWPIAWLLLPATVGLLFLLARQNDDESSPPTGPASRTAVEAPDDLRPATGSADSGSTLTSRSMNWAAGPGGDEPVCFVLVVDQSPAMRSVDPDRLVVTALVGGVEELGTNPWALVTAGSDGQWVEPERGRAGEVIDGLLHPRRGPSTSMSDAIVAADELAELCPSGTRPLTLVVAASPPPYRVNTNNKGFVVAEPVAERWTETIGEPELVSSFENEFGDAATAIANQLTVQGLNVTVDITETVVGATTP